MREGREGGYPVAEVEGWGEGWEGWEGWGEWEGWERDGGG